MSISYQPKDASVQALQLKVQELVLKASDSEVVSIDGSDTIIDLKETMSKDAGVKLALLCLDAGTVSKIAAVDIEYPENGLPVIPATNKNIPGGKKIKIVGVDLSADANDVLVLKYSV